MINLFGLIGLAGVAKNEQRAALIWEKYFQYGISLIAIWLPIQWYLQNVGLIPPYLLVVCYWIIWVILFLESSVLTSLVSDKKKFLLGNWLCLVVVLLSFPPIWFHPSLITAARVARFIIFLRILAPSYKTLTEVLASNHLGLLLLTAVVVTTFSGITITFLDPAISSPWDGIWWAWETITTVGYGDVAPTTLGSRLLAIAMMIFGVMLFSILTASLSAYFVSKGKLKDEMMEIEVEETEMMRRLKNIEIQLAALSEKIIADQHAASLRAQRSNPEV